MTERTGEEGVKRERKKERRKDKENGGDREKGERK